MKFFYNIFLINFFILSLASSSLANDKIAIVNIDYIIKNSNIGLRVLDKIDKQYKKNIDQLEKKNNSLKDLELKIKNKKNVISEKDFNDEVLSFQKKVQDFTNEKNIMVENFNNLRKKETENIFKSFNPIISEYMKKNSISVLLDTKNIFMVSSEANLTDEILKEINSSLK